MPKTEVRGSQIRDTTIGRADLNVATPGLAVITKIVEGSGISISYTGADVGTGDVTINSIGSMGVHGSTHQLGSSDPLPSDFRLGNSLAIGTNSATAGSLRLNNSSIISFRNAANTANIDAIIFGTNNEILFGSGCAYILAQTHLYANPDNTRDIGTPGLRWRDLHLSLSASIGNNPSQTGALRLGNNQSIRSRNVANNDDIIMANLDTGNSIILGDLTKALLFLDSNGAARIRVHGGTPQYIFDNWGLWPNVNNTYNLGHPSFKWANVYATTLIGALDAVQLTGTISDARLSSNVALKNINNNFTAGQSIISSGNLVADFRSSNSRNGYTQWTLNDGSIIGYAGSADILVGTAAQYFTILSTNVMLIRSQANQIEINPASFVSFANKSVRDAMFGGYGEAYSIGSPTGGWWECNLAAYNVFDVYATSGIFNVSIFNARSPVTSFTLIVHYGSTVTAIGWPTNVRWPNDIVPTPSANGRTDIYSFITRDGGGIWLGCVNANLRWY